MTDPPRLTGAPALERRYALLLPDGVQALQAQDLDTGEILDEADSYQWVRFEDVVARLRAALPPPQEPELCGKIIAGLPCLLAKGHEGTCVWTSGPWPFAPAPAPSPTEPIDV